MDKEKEIQEMAGIITDSAFNDMSDRRSRHKYGVSGFYAEALINAGYGNIEKAVREFAEELKGRIREASAFIGDGGNSEFISGFKFFEDNVVKGIDELIKERFGK